MDGWGFNTKSGGLGNGSGTKLTKREDIQNKQFNTKGPKTREPIHTSWIVQILRLWYSPKGGEEAVPSQQELKFSFSPTLAGLGQLRHNLN